MKVFGKFISKPVAFPACMFFFYIALSIVLLFALVLSGFSSSEADIISSLLSDVLVGGICLMALRKIGASPLGKPVILRGSCLAAVLVLLIISWIAMLVMPAAYLTLVGEGDYIIESSFDAPRIVLMLAVAPFCEEALFRGCMYGRFSKTLCPAWLAGVLSSCAFAFLHGFEHFAPMLLFGLLLCILYEFHESLWPCIFAHMAGNAILLALPSLQIKMSSATAYVSFGFCAAVFIATVIWLWKATGKSSKINKL